MCRKQTGERTVMVGAKLPLFVRVVVDSGGAPVAPPQTIDALHVELAAEPERKVAVVWILGEVVPPVRIELCPKPSRKRCWKTSRRSQLSIVFTSKVLVSICMVTQKVELL